MPRTREHPRRARVAVPLALALGLSVLTTVPAAPALAAPVAPVAAAAAPAPPALRTDAVDLTPSAPVEPGPSRLDAAVTDDHDTDHDDDEEQS